MQVGEIFCRHGGSHEAVKLLQQVLHAGLDRHATYVALYDRCPTVFFAAALAATVII